MAVINYVTVRDIITFDRRLESLLHSFTSDLTYIQQRDIS